MLIIFVQIKYVLLCSERSLLHRRCFLEPWNLFRSSVRCIRRIVLSQTQYGVCIDCYCLSLHNIHFSLRTKYCLITFFIAFHSFGFPCSSCKSTTCVSYYKKELSRRFLKPLLNGSNAQFCKT